MQIARRAESVGLTEAVTVAAPKYWEKTVESAWTRMRRVVMVKKVGRSMVVVRGSQSKALNCEF